MTDAIAPTATPPLTSTRNYLQELLPRIVLAPSFVAVLIFVYGFILFTAYLSLTNSKIMPVLHLVGFGNYVRIWALPTWNIALTNLAIYGGLYLVFCTIIGLALAILLDQKIRAEGLLRPIFLYPMALSFIVTGVAWKWFLDPGIGIERTIQSWGWTGFAFGWIKDPHMAIYTVVIAAVWQSSGFVMAMFLAGLRGIDGEIIKASQIDGASAFQLYRRIILPQLRPAFLSVFVVLTHLAIKSYDLVIALTNGGPGRSTELPATFMYSYTFSRNEMAIGATSALIMLMMVSAIVIPYLSVELKGDKR